ncbi:hypothetical protein U9M48_043716 [Paspalum notatum var. saurae]|uniref:Uncharacterized protein n=1 Tax=Paspalum notatum var. saurae TaxID=547442 RepID=A0AAQ3UU15_PASNO
MDSLSQVATRVVEVERGLAEATVVHDDHLRLCSHTGSIGWRSYWETRQAMVDLEIKPCALPPEPSRGSLGGLGPAFSALAGSLAGAKAQLDAQLEEKRREARLTARSMPLGWPNARSPASTWRPWVTKSLTARRCSRRGIVCSSHPGQDAF